MQAMTPEKRVGEICTLLATRAQDVELSSKAAVEGEGKTVPAVGYPKIYVQALLKQVDSAPFIQESAQVERLILSAHPHDALRKIYVNRFTVHIHALHGVKDEVGQVPVVASIAENLRRHVPTYLGQAGLELLTVSSMQDNDDGVYASLDALWAKVKVGDTVLHLENEFLRPIHLHYDMETFGVIAEKDLYTDLGRLKTLQTACEPTNGLLARIG